MKVRLEILTFYLRGGERESRAVVMPEVAVAVALLCYLLVTFLLPALSTASVRWCFEFAFRRKN
jgi:hypothetical protein